MDNKGLCVTCTNDKHCSFPRKFPIIQCEEFSSCATKHAWRSRHKKDRQ